MDYREKIVHGDEGLPVAVYEIDPGYLRYQMHVHWHPEHEILHVRRGEISVRLNDSELELRAGDVIFIPGGTIHSAVPRDCDYTCILVNLTLLMKKSDACMAIANRIGNGSVKIQTKLSEASPRFEEMCHALLCAHREKNEGYPFVIKSVIFAFFGEILNQRLYTREEARVTQSEALALRMKTAISYIEQHYETPIRLKELADCTHMSPNHFCRCFKTVTGQTPFEYISGYRLTKAQHALRTTDMAVTEIALNCGFNDVSHFIRLFRETYGATPKQYRHREDADA